MPSYRDGTVNVLGLTNPGVYVDVIPPTPNITGSPTNFEGFVGVASWGPVNATATFSSVDGLVGRYGTPQIRPGDLATHALAAYTQGGNMYGVGVRVTDGTDTAATATVQSTAGQLTARYSGARGNQIGVTFQPTTAQGAYAAIVSFPGRTPERFDNIYPGLQSITTVAGTGYTSVPAASINVPQKAGGVQTVVQPTLKTLTQAVASGGTGYVVNDKVTLPGGVVLNVATVTSGVISTVTVVNAGALTVGTAPTTAVPVSSTTGSGTGATFTLTWGLGTPNILAYGSGYYLPTGTPMTITLTGGGGTGGSYTPTLSFWAGLAQAINNGTTQRARSSYVVYTPGSSTAAPTLGTPILLTGGTDGANGVGSSQLIGVDSIPRTGMYALRGTGIDAFALCDSVDSSIWATMLAFAISESALAVGTTASGDTISNAIASRIAVGLDDPNFWLIEGDWPSFYDSYNGQSRLVSPTAIALGLLGNLSPEQSPINKKLIGVTATQTSQMGLLTADSDESVANTGGIDLIGRSSSLNEVYFSFLTGRNTSSNTAANVIEYTRLTNFLVHALEGAATRSIVGKLQGIQEDDPTRTKAKFVLDSFFQGLASPSVGSDGYGLIDQFAVQCDLNNNPIVLIQQGFLFAFCAVRYLAVVRYFVIKLAGGSNVTVTVQDNQPTVAQLAA